MFAYFRAPVGWLEIIKRTVEDSRRDGCVGMAAQLAFYFFLALFPALIFLIALLGFVPVGSVVDNALGGLGQFAPSDVVGLVRRQLNTAASSHGGLLTFGVVGAIWSSSAAMTAIISALNRAYDIEEWRPWWKRRVIAILLTLGLAAFILASLAIVMVGPAASQAIGRWLGVGAAVAPVWNILQWPFAFLLVVFAIDLIYYFAPNADTEWVWMTPGSVLATTLWLLTSIGFKLYVGRISSFDAMYGAIGSVIVVMLWFYASGFAILVGAEMNAVIDKALPYGDAGRPTSRRARKKIGPAAEREHRRKNEL